eukprot:775468-Prymnesium_polylepis.1
MAAGCAHVLLVPPSRRTDDASIAPAGPFPTPPIAELASLLPQFAVATALSTASTASTSLTASTGAATWSAARRSRRDPSPWRRSRNARASATEPAACAHRQRRADRRAPAALASRTARAQARSAAAGRPRASHRVHPPRSALVEGTIQCPL